MCEKKPEVLWCSGLAKETQVLKACTLAGKKNVSFRLFLL